MPQVLIELKNLKKHFHVGPQKTLHAVDGVNLSIYENEILGLVGESGCGKSTLGRTIAGLYEKTSGEVHIAGNALPLKYSSKDFLKLSQTVQMIFQDPFSSLNPRMTVKEIISEGPLINKLWLKDEVHTKACLWMKKVGLSEEHLSRYPHEFSGGQRQRIGIARALAMQPKFIICDEPISALDVSIQAQIINLLGELKNEFSLTILFIAHDLSMVRYVSDRMAVMYLGSVVEIGPSDQLFFEPHHPYTKMLIASNPEPDPSKGIDGEKIKGEIPTPINIKPGCRFASRCPLAKEICRTKTPFLEKVGENHFAACFEKMVEI